MDIARSDRCFHHSQAFVLSLKYGHFNFPLVTVNSRALIISLCFTMSVCRMAAIIPFPAKKCRLRLGDRHSPSNHHQPSTVFSVAWETSQLAPFTAPSLRPQTHFFVGVLRAVATHLSDWECVTTSISTTRRG